MNDRVQAAKDFWYATAHDLDDGFALPLRNRIHNWRDLFQPRWQRVPYYWAKAHRLHSRRSEAKHASNKKATATCTDYLHFVSRCANQDRLSTIFHDEIPEPLAASPAKIKGPLPSLQLRWANQCATRDKSKLSCPIVRATYQKEWDDLLEDHQGNFRAYHEAEFAKELSAKRARSQQQSCTALVPLAPQAQGILANTEPGPLSTEVVIQHHVVGCGVSSFVPRGVRDSGKSLPHTPMSTACFKEFLDKNKFSVTSASEAVDSQPFLPLARDRGQVPKKVKYHRPCVGVCTELADQVSCARRTMVGKIDKAMQAMVKDFKVDQLEVLLCIEKTVDGDQVLTEFLMPAALLRSGNAGIWSPTMAGITFEAGSSCGQRPYTGTLLCMARESHTPAQFTSYASFTDGVDVGLFYCVVFLLLGVSVPNKPNPTQHLFFLTRHPPPNIKGWEWRLRIYMPTYVNTHIQYRTIMCLGHQGVPGSADPLL